MAAVTGLPARGTRSRSTIMGPAAGSVNGDTNGELCAATTDAGINFRICSTAENAGLETGTHDTTERNQLRHQMRPDGAVETIHIGRKNGKQRGEPTARTATIPAILSAWLSTSLSCAAFTGTNGRQPITPRDYRLAREITPSRDYNKHAPPTPDSEAVASPSQHSNSEVSDSRGISGGRAVHESSRSEVSDSRGLSSGGASNYRSRTEGNDTRGGRAQQERSRLHVEVAAASKVASKYLAKDQAEGMPQSPDSISPILPAGGENTRTQQADAR